MEQKKQSFHVKKKSTATFVGTQPSVGKIFLHPLPFLPLKVCLLFTAQSKPHSFIAF